MIAFDVAPLFENITGSNCNLIRAKTDDSAIGVYYGKNSDGNYRLAFLSKSQPPLIDSTNSLKVVQWSENTNLFWTCVDLIDDRARTVYYILGNDLIAAALSKTDDADAMIAVKNRFYSWRKMFQRASTFMTEEAYKGLFGELFVLNHIMIPQFGVEKAIRGWGGPDKTAKDFSINDTWWEVKTISVKSSTITITSLAQLESNVDGHLVAVKVERMSDAYDDGECMVSELMDSIVSQIKEDELREVFLTKLVAYGYSINNEGDNYRYSVDAVARYAVGNGFPRLTHKEVPFSEITNISYELSLPAIEQYKEN